MHIVPTEYGKKAQKCHQEIRLNMVDAIVANITEDELEVLGNTLDSIAEFLTNSYKV